MARPSWGANGYGRLPAERRRQPRESRAHHRVHRAGRGDVFPSTSRRPCKCDARRMLQSSLYCATACGLSSMPLPGRSGSGFQ